MLARFKKSYSELSRQMKPYKEAANYRRMLATTALLIRAATMDRELSPKRYSKLASILSSSFSLNDQSTIALIRKGLEANHHAIDLYGFTKLFYHSAFQERKQLVAMMWEMIYSDSDRASEFEENLVRRVADLLGIPSRERINLRRRMAVKYKASCASA